MNNDNNVINHNNECPPPVYNVPGNGVPYQPVPPTYQGGIPPYGYGAPYGQMPGAHPVQGQGNAPVYPDNYGYPVPGQAPAPYYNGYQPTPSMVYYNNQTGTAPQYHYGNPVASGVILNKYYAEQSRFAENRRRLAKKLKATGNIVGGAALLCLVFAYMFSFAYQALRSLVDPSSVVMTVLKSFNDTVAGSSLFQILYTVLVVGVSFGVFRKLLAKTCDEDIFIGSDGKIPAPRTDEFKVPSLSFGIPKGGFKVVLIIMLSVGGCLVANNLTIILSAFYSIVGLDYVSPEGPLPINTWDFVARFCATAIMPAIVEEVALRGVIMSPLRKFGNGFAIVLSAFVFGLFHGNLDQIPFAFLCGLFMGYACIITESLWTGIIIHAINNSISCIQLVFLTLSGEDAAVDFYAIISLVGIALGVVALLIYIKRYKKADLPKIKSNNEYMSNGKMFKTAITCPAMIVAIVLYALEAIAPRLLGL